MNGHIWLWLVLESFRLPQFWQGWGSKKVDDQDILLPFVQSGICWVLVLNLVPSSIGTPS